MTDNEARKAIEAGQKVTHRYFSDDEFITIASDGSQRYEDEKGYLINPAIFWTDRRSEAFKIDWEIYHQPK